MKLCVAEASNIFLALRLDTLELLLHGRVLICHAKIFFLLLLGLLLQIIEVALGGAVAGHNFIQILNLLLQVRLGFQKTLVLFALLGSLKFRITLYSSAPSVTKSVGYLGASSLCSTDVPVPAS